MPQRTRVRRRLLLQTLGLGCVVPRVMAQTEAVPPALPSDGLPVVQAPVSEQTTPPGSESVAPALDRVSIWQQQGLASWYGGRRWHGRRTASGEPFDRHALTAAHRTLPLGSWVRVLNPANGQEVVVRINDRGPFARRRIIDLSEAAAEQIGLRDLGHAQVYLSLFSDSDRLLAPN